MGELYVNNGGVKSRGVAILETERRVFFNRMGRLCGSNSIIVGDFNVWCARLDASSNACFKSDTSRGVLKEMMEERGMIDVWRERNPERRVFSRRQVVMGV
uniref:Endonuclease/exonuclease/phosphatase domain-containing protein n=1 Tax=Seriola lalandi dorsalis TaxID=1841481 RepID=A0A3B4WLU1_SERLL